VVFFSTPYSFRSSASCIIPLSVLLPAVPAVKNLKDRKDKKYKKAQF
jgi:hypothetical protein